MMAAGLGAGLMYLLDPRSGKRRRALVRDKARRALTDASGAMRPAFDRMRVHAEPDGVPALQGGGARAGARSAVRGNWPPAYRLAASAGGALVTLLGARRRGMAGFLLGSFGTSLLARGVTNTRLRRLMGADAAEPAIDVSKTITIDAPVERVFALWSDIANFPQFMRNVREVRDLGHGRSEWTVAGPAGAPVKWTAVISDYMPNELLAWRTERGAAVHHAGVVRFDRDGEATRVTVRLSYHPAGGPLGHVVATLFGADPKSEMDADLARMKTFIETGTQPHDAAQSEPPRARSAPGAASGSGGERTTTISGTQASLQTRSEPRSRDDDEPGDDEPRSLH
jgi:uncharacterized membrane protein